MSENEFALMKLLTPSFRLNVGRFRHFYSMLTHNKNPQFYLNTFYADCLRSGVCLLIHNDNEKNSTSTTENFVDKFLTESKEGIILESNVSSSMFSYYF